MKIHVVDDDDAFRDSLLWLLESHDYQVEGHDSAEAFLIGRTRG
ncbi:DNA-binding response regulator, partial [Aquitalea sp. S1-19]|nr:DNA-binding response regulator [Aquitalea sp. S1-19]